MIVYSPAVITQFLGGAIALRNDRIGYRNLIPTSTLTASSSQIGFPVTTLRNGLTQIYWRPTSLPATVDITPPAGSMVDFCGLAGHDLGTQGATVTLQGESTPGNYVDIASVTPTTNEPIFFIIELSAYSSYRLSFDNPDAPTNLFSLAVVYLGRSLEMERGPDFGYQPIELSRDDRTIPQRSGSGGFIGAVVERRGNKSSVSYSNLTNDWYRRYFDPFVDAAVTTPFFHVSLPRPEASTTLDFNFAEGEFAAGGALSSKNGGVAFVRIPEGDNISPSKGPNNGRFDVSFNMEGLTRG